jgi:hypothetical protein
MTPDAPCPPAHPPNQISFGFTLLVALIFAFVSYTVAPYPVPIVYVAGFVIAFEILVAIAGAVWPREKRREWRFDKYVPYCGELSESNASYYAHRVVMVCLILAVWAFASLVLYRHIVVAPDWLAVKLRIIDSHADHYRAAITV